LHEDERPENSLQTTRRCEKDRQTQLLTTFGSENLCLLDKMEEQALIWMCALLCNFVVALHCGSA
jgi:hypothetical protein